jgi:hypothetical protein
MCEQNSLFLYFRKYLESVALSRPSVFEENVSPSPLLKVVEAREFLGV